MDYVLRTFDLSKRYKKQTVLDKVNINIEKGDIYGFVGENGSGTTTVIRLITGLIHPNGGSFELFGVKNLSPAILDARRRIGAIVETPSIYLNMSASDNIKMQCGVFGVSAGDRVATVLREVGLYDLIDSKKNAANYSLGMRQRLGIAMALVSDPEFIILDEPMNGLDPAGIVDIRELILRLNRERGITFLISSHILTELALVATKYGIISKGRIVKEITADELRQECRSYLYVATPTPTELGEALGAKYGSNVMLVSGGVRIYGELDMNVILREILDTGVTVTSINTSETGIEDYYLRAIGGAKNA
jgi:ABC-2 type transport system ATP-binding protein